MKHTPIYENCRLDLKAVLALEEKYGIADDALRHAAATLDEFHVGANSSTPSAHVSPKKSRV